LRCGGIIGRHRILKAIFETKQIYPQAYRITLEYRKWLLKELFDLIFSLETHALKPSADMVLNLIDGLMFQILSSKRLEERDVVVERFFWGLGLAFKI
jgi:hypothetical protein